MASERREKETPFADLAIAKLLALAPSAPDAGNEDLAIADRFRIAKAKDPATLKVGGQNLRTLRRPLCGNNENENATRNEPPKSVIQENGLKSFPRVC